MNEPKPLETQLSSWPPRRPAARLKARLFPDTARLRSGFSAVAFGWRLSPVLGCVVLALAAFRADPQPTSLTAGMKTNNLLATLAWSDQFVLAGAAADFRHNLWHVPTFASTKASPSNSTMSSFRLLQTNSLMRD